MAAGATSRETGNQTALTRLAAAVESDLRSSLERSEFLRSSDQAPELARFVTDRAFEKLKNTLLDLERDGKLGELLEQVFASISGAARDDHYLTSQEAAVLLKVSRSTMNSLLDAGKLGEVLKTEGGHRRVGREAVLAYKERRRASRLKALETYTKLSDDMKLDDGIKPGAEFPYSTSQGHHY